MSPRLFARMAAHVQLLPVLESGEETLVGGQAVMEGVMMRAPHSYCVAVRRKNGELVTDQMPVPRMSEKYPLYRYPVLRGIGTLWQAMSLGIKALQFSANAALADEEGDTAKQTKPKEIPGWAMAMNLAISFGFFFFAYKIVPLFVVSQLEKVYPELHGRIAFNLVDGIVRILIFIGFLFGISRWKEIRRVFEYHGAEHKVVFNFESGKPVTVDNAQNFKTWHPRCGTSFLIVVMVVSMIVYMFIPFETFLGKILSRLVLIPVIAGLSYEMIRFAARRPGSVMAVLTAPGLWLQRITTQAPSDEQTGVAIHALEGAMKLETDQGGQAVIA